MTSLEVDMQACLSIKSTPQTVIKSTREGGESGQEWYNEEDEEDEEGGLQKRRKEEGVGGYKMLFLWNKNNEDQNMTRDTPLNLNYSVLHICTYTS